MLPTVITYGKFPGKLTLPNEGPSLPAETIIIIPLLSKSINLFLISSSLKLIPPKDKFMTSIFFSKAKSSPLRNQSVKVFCFELNIFIEYSDISGAIPSSFPHKI